MKKIVEARTKREHRNLGWFGFRFMALFGKGMPWIEWCLSTIHVLFLTFSYFLIIINIKTFLFFFFFFISHQKKIITIQIEKFNTIQNFFTFLYKFFLLYITLSLFTNSKINNPLLCSTQTFAKQGHMSATRMTLIGDLLHTIVYRVGKKW
jgi:hypothetical protein